MTASGTSLPPGDSVCPGCALRMPRRASAQNTSYYNASAECWSVYSEVLGEEYSNAVLFGQVHQLTVDTYAVQHAGGSHPDKSMGIHLCGLYLVLVLGHRPPLVPPLLQRLAGEVDVWPHFVPPPYPQALTVFEVALAGSMEEHIARVREWASAVWLDWGAIHGVVAEIVSSRLGAGWSAAGSSAPQG